MKFESAVLCKPNSNEVCNFSFNVIKLDNENSTFSIMKIVKLYNHWVYGLTKYGCNEDIRAIRDME